MIIAAKSFEGKRFRVRRVDEEAFTEKVRQKALSLDDWVVDVTHGGTMGSQWGTHTECILALSDPVGIVVYWASRVSSNKPTRRGAAQACFLDAGDLFDARLKDNSRKQFALEALKKAHRAAVPAMVVLAMAAKDL